MSDRDRVEVDAGNNRVVVTVDKGVYPLEVVYGAAYIFIDRCFVLLDVPAESEISIDMRGRESLDEAGLRALAGELGNELLTQVWRQETVKRNSAIIEAVAAQAIAGAAGPDDLDDFGDLGDLDDDDLGDDAFDDPLGIAVPWEEKYGKEAAGDPQVADSGPTATDAEAKAKEDDG